MPFLDPEKLRNIAAKGLVEFTPEDLLRVDEQGRTLFYHLLEEVLPTKEKPGKAIQDAAGMKMMELIANLAFNPYTFNRAINPDISIALKTKAVGKGKNLHEETLTHAEGFAGPLDYTLLQAFEEIRHYSDYSPNVELARELLKRPVEIDEAYFKRVFATLAQKIKGFPKNEKRIEIIGAYASLLVGMDVLAILKDKHDYYHSHVMAYRKERVSARGDTLSGFLPWHFLPLRVFFTLQLLLEVQLKQVSDDDLKQFIEPLHLKTVVEVRENIILQLKKELKRNLQTYWISRYGYYIGNTGASLEQRNTFLSALAKGVVESIKKLEENDSVIIYLAWQGDEIRGSRGKRKDEDHALYLQVHKKNGKWNVLIHNLGAFNDLHKKIKKDGEECVHPYGLGSLDAEAWQAEGVGVKYIEAVLKALYPLKTKSHAYPIYYNTDRKILSGPHVQAILPDEYEASPAQRAANCVYENNTATRKISFPELFNWIQYDEAGKTAPYERLFSVSKIPFNHEQLSVLNTRPSDEPPKIEEADAKSAFIASPLEAFKLAYRNAYSVIPSVSRFWRQAKPMKMEHYWVELSLVQGTRAEHEGVHELRPIKVAELVANGGHQWIEGQFGAGKSTFLQHIAYQWACESPEIAANYQLVILLPLRQLQASNRISGDTAEKKLMSCLGQIYFDHYDDEARDAFVEKLLQDKDIEILWLLDGWNEMDASLGPDIKEIVDYIKEQRHVFISTRPLALSKEEAARPHIVVKGLSDENISKWMDTHINDPELVAPEDRASLMEKKELILAKLKTNERVWELIHYPIILKIICMALVHDRLEVELSSVAQIYQVMFEMFAEHHCARIEDEKVDEYWAKLEQVLAVFARRILLDDNRLIVPEELLRNIVPLIEQDYKRNWPDEVMSCGLLTPAKPSLDPKQLVPLYFMHDSFYEYLGAKSLVGSMTGEGEKFVALFKMVKYEPRFQVVWRFISGLISDIELANAWFSLWFDYPLRMSMSDVNVSDLEQVADLIMESPVRGKLPLRTALLNYIKTHWQPDITIIPRAVAKLIRATDLWSHPDAKDWIAQIDGRIDAWNEYLPHPGKSKPLDDKGAQLFYKNISNIARLLKDIHSTDPKLLRFLEEKLTAGIDLKLRDHGNNAGGAKAIDDKLVKVAPQNYLQQRLRLLTAIIKVKMDPEDKEAIAQFEDALLWGAQQSYGKEFLRLAIQTIADHKLNQAGINERLYSFLQTFKRTDEHIATLRLIVDALVEQVSKAPGILAALVRYIRTTVTLGARQGPENPLLVKHILEALARYQYADPAYINRLFAVLDEIKNTTKLADYIKQALSDCKNYAPALADDIEARLAAVAAKYSVAIEITEDSLMDEEGNLIINARVHLAALNELFGLLHLKTEARRKLGEKRTNKDLQAEYDRHKKLFNQNMGALADLPVATDAFQELLHLFDIRHLDEPIIKEIVAKGCPRIFADFNLYQNLPESILHALIESVSLEAKDRCVIYFKDGGIFEFTTEAEVAFWQKLCPLYEVILARTLRSEDSAVTMSSAGPLPHDKPMLGPTAAIRATGTKRKREAGEEEVTSSRPAAGMKERIVNCDYLYEDQDITAILNARVEDYNNLWEDKSVYVMAAVDNITPNSLSSRLDADKKDHSGKRIALIPCNLGNYHWVGLLFEFNEADQCIRAEFINSLHSSTPPILNAQLQKVYPGISFQERFDLIRQDDAMSCGPCAVENLVLSMTRSAAANKSSMASIRARHLNLLHRYIESPGISDVEKARRTKFYHEFKHRQAYNIPSFNPQSYTGFDRTKVKSKPELLAIASIASLISHLDEKLKEEICQALPKVFDSQFVEDSGQVIRDIRQLLWRHIDNPLVKEVSRLIFGTAKTPEIDTYEKYDRASQLVFNEYDFLVDIYNLVQSGKVKQVLDGLQKPIQATTIASLAADLSSFAAHSSAQALPVADMAMV